MVNREFDPVGGFPQRECFVGDFSRLTAESALNVLRGWVTGELVCRYLAEIEMTAEAGQKERILDLLNNSEFVEKFCQFWKTAIRASQRKQLYNQSDVAKYAEKEGVNAAMLHTAAVHALGATYCGAGILLGDKRPLGGREKHVDHFTGMKRSQLVTVDANYHFALGYFDYVFDNATRKSDDDAGFKKAA